MKKILIVPVVMIALATFSQTNAWVEPDQLPPNGNIAAPLNTGSFAQSKIGGLILGLGNTLYGLIVKNGNSGFGTETPTEKVDVNGNIKLNGRIIGLQAPVAGQDAVNKDYVDQYVDNLNKKFFSGVAGVGFYNGQPESTIAHISFPTECVNPTLFTQTVSGSIACGDNSGPTVCFGHPGSTSTDLHSYYGNLNSSGADVFLSTMDNVYACADRRVPCATSDTWKINWFVICNN